MPIPSESLATQRPVEDGKTSGGTDSDKERRKKNAAGGLNFVSAEFDNENWQKKAVRDPVERIKIKDSEGDPDQDTATETEKTVIKTVINTLESFEGNDEKPVEMFSHNRIRKRGKGRQKVEKMLPIVKQRNPEEATENTEDFVSDNPDRSAKAKTDPLPNPQRLEQPLPMTRTGFKPRCMSLGVLIIVIIIGSLLYIDLKNKTDEKIERLEKIVNVEIEKVRKETERGIDENRKGIYLWSSCDVVPRTEHESWKGKGGIKTVFRAGRLYEVYCDMTTDGGGWTVFQRRMDGSVDFYKTWEEYAEGFGNKSGEFWLGLEAVHQLTQDGAYELRVDLTDWDGSTAYAKYGTFSISGRSDNYRLTVGEYSGTAGDSLTSPHSNNSPFSAKNKDLSANNCPTGIGAAWWFYNCAYSSLNGRYNDTSHGGSGVYWQHWKGYSYSLKGSEMKFRKK